MSSTLIYAMLLVPVLGCGGAMTCMMLDIPRREENKQRVSRALLAFWMSMAVMISTHSVVVLS